MKTCHKTDNGVIEQTHECSPQEEGWKRINSSLCSVPLITFQLNINLFSTPSNDLALENVSVMMLKW